MNTNLTKLPFGYGSPPAGSSPQSFSSPRVLSDRETLVKAQVRKLAEMRKSQMAFFDSKMGALREAESRVNNRVDELRKKEEALIEKESQMSRTRELIRAETDELVAIRELLKVENESVQTRVKELRRLVKKYENTLKALTSDATAGKHALLDRLQIQKP